MKETIVHMTEYSNRRLERILDIQVLVDSGRFLDRRSSYISEEIYLKVHSINHSDR